MRRRGSRNQIARSCIHLEHRDEYRRRTSRRSTDAVSHPHRRSIANRTRSVTAKPRAASTSTRHRARSRPPGTRAVAREITESESRIPIRMAPPATASPTRAGKSARRVRAASRHRSPRVSSIHSDCSVPMHDAVDTGISACNDATSGLPRRVGVQLPAGAWFMGYPEFSCSAEHRRWPDAVSRQRRSARSSASGRSWRTQERLISMRSPSVGSPSEYLGVMPNVKFSCSCGRRVVLGAPRFRDGRSYRLQHQLDRTAIREGLRNAMNHLKHEPVFVRSSHFTCDKYNSIFAHSKKSQMLHWELSTVSFYPEEIPPASIEPRSSIPVYG